jgi:DNA processing protein
MAGEQGREVFALPGHPLDPRAEGTNGLLKSGATLVTEPDDVLQALVPLLRERPIRMAEPPRVRQEPLPLGDPHATGSLVEADRDRLIEALGPAPVDVDALARATGLSPRLIQIGLLELALAGRIERHGHHLVSLKQ